MTATGWPIPPGHLEPGDVLLTQNSSYLSRAIRSFTRERDGQPAWASHAGMILSADPAPLVIESLWRVRVRPLEAYHAPGVRTAVWRAPGGLVYRRQEAVTLEALRYEGAEYGWWKIALHALDHLAGNRYLFRRLARMKRYPICSWLVAWAYHDALGVDFGMPPNEASPDDLMDWCVDQGWELVWADSFETRAAIAAVYEG